MGPRNAVLGGGDACETSQWGLRWSSLRGHETLSWVGETNANCATGPSVELPMGPRDAVLGGGDACECSHWGLRWSSLRGHETLS